MKSQKGITAYIDGANLHKGVIDSFRSKSKYFYYK